MFHIDSYYLLLVVPALILSLAAQGFVKSSFSRYSKVKTRRRITGAEAAQLLLRANGIHDVAIEQVQGSMTDHYNPSTKKLALSQTVYGSDSIAAIGVAAHETGHAIQHAKGYGPLWLRSTLVPVANIGSMFGPYMAIAGLMFGMPILTDIGILLFAGAVCFYFITLPVEFNASSRAITLLERNAVLSADELSGAKRVLNAAAMTYVASALVAVMSLLRLILLSRSRRD